MGAVAEKTWTYRDYLKLDDDRRYEILEGALTEMTPSPNADHQYSSAALTSLLFRFTKERHLGRVFSAPFDVILDEWNVLQPDLIFIAKDRESIIKKRGIAGAPDLAVEIISPSSQQRDTVKKPALYARFGVREYWLVDPAAKSIEVLRLGDNHKFELFSAAKADAPGSRAKSKILPGLEVTPEAIFVAF